MNLIKSLKKTIAILTASVFIGSLAGQSVFAAGPAQSSQADHLKSLQKRLLEASLQRSPHKSSQQDASAFIAPDIDTSSSKKIKVIVRLSVQPAAVGIYAAKQGNRKLAQEFTQEKVAGEQTAFLDAAKAQGIDLSVNYKFDTVLNGMEVTVNANQIQKLAKITGVQAIHPNLIYHPISEPGSLASETLDKNDMVPLKQIGVDKAWEMGFTGKGLKVGVLDTGVDYAHPDLKGAFQQGSNGPVYGYDSFNQDLDPYEDLPRGYFGGYPGSSHGTHVSGTIVGRAVNVTGDFNQKGVAYKAELHSYKVLGVKDDDYTSEAPTGTSAQIINGIEHAVEDHMDVINLSLGSALAKDANSPDSIAVNNAVLAGVIAVVANGNDGSSGHYYYSMGSPASAQLAISVAAATSPSVQYEVSVKDSVLAQSNLLRLVAWQSGQTDFGSIFGTKPVEAVYVGLGRETDYISDPTMFKDKIVFISRGIISFEEKVKTAKKMGAKAIIIFNGIDKVEDGVSVPNLADDIPGRNGPIGSIAALGDGHDYIPLIDMPGQLGRAIARQLQKWGTLQFNFGSDFKVIQLKGDTVAEFSSRGPNSDGNYSIKPDVSAPGVNIYSTIPAYGKVNPNQNYEHAYARESGTSMASPHVAGLALLVKEKHQDWSPADVRAALANTADEINKDGTLYDVYSQGSGRVNIVNALKTPALLQALDKITIYDNQYNPITMDSEAPNLSFGMIQEGSEASKPLQLKNTSGGSLTYTAQVVMHPKVTSDPDPTRAIPTPNVKDIKVTLDGLDTGNSNKITVGPYDRYRLTLTAKTKAKAQPGVYEGEVLLTNAKSGIPPLHLPFVIHVGEDDSANNSFAIQNIKLSNDTVTSDKPVDISFTLHSNTVNYILIALYGLDENFLGYVSYINDIGIKEDTEMLNYLPAGKITIPDFDGTYVDQYLSPEGENVIKQLPDGNYRLGIIANSFNPETGELEDQTAIFKSIFVQNSSAESVTPSP